MPDCHIIGDMREVDTEHRASRGVQRDYAVRDQAHDGQGRKALASTRDGELCVDCVRQPEPAVGQPVGLGKLSVVTMVDSDHPREPGLGGDAVDGFGEIVHGTMVRPA